MADPTLLGALSGLQFRGIDSPYGIGAQAIGQATPALINPYGSVGSNLGIALGSTLIQSLLGYQARQDAAEQSVQALRYGNQLMSAKTPEERLGIIESVPNEGWFGPDMRSRLTGLTSQLNAADTLGAQQARNNVVKEIELLKALGNFSKEPEFNDAIAAQQAVSEAKAAGVTQRVKFMEEEKNKRQLRAAQIAEQKAVFDKRLSLENPEVPAEVRNNVSLMTATGNRAHDLADRIEAKLETFPQFKLAKNFTTAGDGIKEEFDDLKDLLLRARSGAAAGDKEAARVTGILEGTIEVGPAQAIQLLRQFAANAYTFSADRLSAASTSPVTLVEQLRGAANSGNKASLFMQAPQVPNTPKNIDLETGEAIKAAAQKDQLTTMPQQPTAQAKSTVEPQVAAQVAALTRQIQQTTDPAEKQRLYSQAKALLGK